MNHVQATSVWNLIRAALPYMREEGIFYNNNFIWCWPRSESVTDYYSGENIFEQDYCLMDASRLRYTKVGGGVLVCKGRRPVALVGLRSVMDLESGHTFRMERT